MPLGVRILIGLLILAVALGLIGWLLFRRPREKGMLGSEVVAALRQDGWVFWPGPPPVLTNDFLKMRIVRGSWTIGDPAGDMIRFMRDGKEVYRIDCPLGEQPDTQQEGEILSTLRQWGFR